MQVKAGSSLVGAQISLLRKLLFHPVKACLVFKVFIPEYLHNQADASLDHKKISREISIYNISNDQKSSRIFCLISYTSNSSTMQATPAFSNYCACFIDLLGQKNLLQGQSVIPDKADTEAYKQFTTSAYKSIGAIDELQKQAEYFMQGTEKFSMRDQITESELTTYEEMKAAKPKQQRWSDGLVFYHSLATDKMKCPMNAVIEIFMLSGTLCLLGLATGTPIRGAIEVSWGVELHENELYGAVVANSYILESVVAQCPRVVVGPHVINYLKAHLDEVPDPDDKIAIYNQNLAARCLKMTAVDQDGHAIIHYLGQDFKDWVLSGEDDHPTLYEMACTYIAKQYSKYSAQKNSKLAIRYAWVKGYFEQHRHIHTLGT